MTGCDLVSIVERYLELKNSIPPRVSVLAACKYLDDSSVRELTRFDELVFGENYVLDAAKRGVKIPRERYHFIGKLQRNKVRDAVRFFGTIQTVDSKKLAEKVSGVAGEEGVSVGAYVQVNLENNPKHGGIKESELEDFIDYVRMLPNVRLIGLMLLGDPKRNDELFKKLKLLADKYSLKTSMGTSGDFKKAISAGSDMVRIGRALLT